MYLIRFIRTNQNKLIIYSDTTFTYSYMETNPDTGKSDLVYKSIESGTLQLYATNDIDQFEGKSQVVSIILFKNKNDKIQRSVENENESDSDKQILKNHISIYYGEEVCCTECNYYCNGSRSPVNAIAVLSVIFSLLLLIFSITWIIYSIVILCRKWRGPTVNTDDSVFENNRNENKGINFENNHAYMVQDSGRNVKVRNDLEESNDFQTNGFETDNVK